MQVLEPVWYHEPNGDIRMSKWLVNDNTAWSSAIAAGLINQTLVKLGSPRDLLNTSFGTDHFRDDVPMWQRA